MTSPEPGFYLISISRMQRAETMEVSCVQFRGSLHSSTALDFRARLQESGRRSPFLVVDVTAMETLDYTGLAMLQEQHRMQCQRGGWLRVVTGGRTPVDLSLYETEVEAMRDAPGRAA